MKRKFLWLNVVGLIFILALSPGTAWAQQAVACESDVVVQADDWLSKIAQKFYDDPLAFPAIANATNAKATTDTSYATIQNPDVIEPGWKLCIPSKADAQAMMGQPAPTVAPAPGAATGTQPASASVVPITLVQLNDIYEITPVSGGAEGGLARVATASPGIPSPAGTPCRSATDCDRLPRNSAPPQR